MTIKPTSNEIRYSNARNYLSKCFYGFIGNPKPIKISHKEISYARRLQLFPSNSQEALQISVKLKLFQSLTLPPKEIIVKTKSNLFEIQTTNRLKCAKKQLCFNYF